MFLYGVIVPVVPFALTARAGVPEGDAQHWVSVLLAVYGAALLVSAPISGWYADRTSSRRLPLLFGLVALTGATVLLCLARSVALMVVGRLLQGCAAGVVWTVGMALMVDTVGQKDIGQLLGYVGISMSVGIIAAPLVGGVVYQRCGYYAVYYVCFGLLALDIGMRLALIEKKIAAQWDDVVGVKPEASVGETTTEEVRGEDEQAKVVREKDLDVPGGTSSTDASTTNEAVTTSSGPRPRHPMLTLLSSRRLLAALWACLIQASILTAFDSVLPLFVARTFSWSPTGAGLIFLPILIPGFFAPLFGAIADRYGPRWLAVSGFLGAIPCLVLLRFVDHDSTRQVVLLCALLALLGTALAAVMPPLMAEITYIVEAKEVRSPGIFGAKGAYAQAYGLFVMAFAGGCLVGPIWAGFVDNKSGWGTMGWSLAILSFAGAVPVFIWAGGLVTRNNAKTGAERAAGKKEVKVDDGGEEGVVGEGAR
ncbi:hypothetical protein GMDG_06849 [Pseudogymnoascus destructans 20631-21]|uniref:Major facilitator superfamily (MFS) profile domain-containing protein n=2 Tax=Pseudogymnoascus destructans TaxID=655981 RepID=L8FVM8_PSED2|nr:hypothetical protein GMDG_06849 [Pseudogymnoascus destructans 20631-21]